MKPLRFQSDLNETVDDLCNFSSQYLVRIQWDLKWDFDLGMSENKKMVFLTKIGLISNQATLKWRLKILKNFKSFSLI